MRRSGCTLPSYGWSSFTTLGVLRCQCVHLLHVRMCKKPKKCTFLIAQGVLNNMLPAVSSTGVTRKCKRNNTVTLWYMKLGKVSYRQPNCCVWIKGPNSKAPSNAAQKCGCTVTILHGFTYPKILCTPKNEERKREDGDIACRRSSLSQACAAEIVT